MFSNIKNIFEMMTLSISQSRVTPLVVCKTSDNEPKKRQSEFQKKVLDSRKGTLKSTFTDVQKLLKKEKDESKQLFDEHVDFFKKEWDYHSTKKNTEKSTDEENIDTEEDFLE